MGDNSEFTGMTGLQFFGRISASISHEIKNVMAVINENAGLLEDFTNLADRGVAIDSARLKVMAATIKRQIGRADGIIRNMNRFAHAADHTFTDIELAQTIELFIALTSRFAAMQGIQVELQLPQDPVKFRTAPFILMNLLWLCLEFCMSAAGDQKRIQLVAAEAQGGVRIQFRRLAGLTETLLETFPSDREKGLLEVLGAALTIAEGGDAIVLQL